MRAAVVWIFQVVDIGALATIVALNSLYLLLSVVAYVERRRHRHQSISRELGTVMRSTATPAISLIVPANNEESTIRERVRSLFDLNFPEFEVVIVNDGSTDRTLDTAIKAFALMRTPPTHRQPLATQPVRGLYRSLTNRGVVVIDKEHGGRADAINAGINAARYPLVCVIDADSRLEDDALARAVLPFVENSSTIAAGSPIRIGHSRRPQQGRAAQSGLPASRLAMFQMVEQLRTFLTARLAESVFKGLMTISSAFCIFKRDVVIDAGGYRSDTIGEDVEMLTRLHRLCLERGQPYRIVFQPEAVCWAAAAETVPELSRRRNLRQRGMLRALRAHAPLMLNARYGSIGLLALPYYFVVEGVGPLVELLGYVVTAVGVAFGFLDWRFAQLLFLAAVLYGMIISMTTVLLQELSAREFPRATDFLRLAAYSVLENLGYRQLATWWRVTGIVDFLRGVS